MRIARGVLASDVCTMVTIMLVWDKDPDNATPLGSALQTGAAPLSHRNLNNRDRWLFLKTWKFNLSSTTRPCAQFKKYKRFSLRTVANGAGALISDIRSGALWLYVVSDATVGNDEPTITFNCRVRFTDA